MNEAKNTEKDLSKEILKKKYDKVLTLESIKSELDRTGYRHKYSTALKGTIYSLIVVAAIAVLIATLWMPVLQIYGSSMYPTLAEGDVVVSIKGSKFKTGEIVGFYYGKKLLVKRYIAGPGDWVNIDKDGNVYVNEVLIEEPYLEEGTKALGKCDIELPYQIPDNSYFVIGDNRSVSVDSRNTAVGNVSQEQLVGKITFRVWPFSHFGKIE